MVSLRIIISSGTCSTARAYSIRSSIPRPRKRRPTSKGLDIIYAGINSAVRVQRDGSSSAKTHSWRHDRLSVRKTYSCQGDDFENELALPPPAPGDHA